jgi:hypothetical protein
MLKITIALAFIGFSVTAAAQDQRMMQTARDLLQVCTTADRDSVGYCNGFMQAVHDFPATAEIPIACPPQGTTRTQMVETYVAWATRLSTVQPDLLEAPAILVARNIMARAYPC